MNLEAESFQTRPQLIKSICRVRPPLLTQARVTCVSLPCVHKDILSLTFKRTYALLTLLRTYALTYIRSFKSVRSFKTFGGAYVVKFERR